MAVTFTHIINPFTAKKTSDLYYAQPITFETMRVAKEKAPKQMNINLLATIFPEDIEFVPPFFNSTSPLEQSVLNFHPFETPIKLPLIGEILSKAYNETQSDYIIYTNVDIGLYPDFYNTVYNLVQQGHDAIIINRTRIPPKFTSIDDLGLIYKQPGKPHPGFDCFIFKREIFPKMQLESVCIGVPFVEITLSQNLFHLSDNFILLKSEYNTFHLGMEVFKKRAPKEYFHFNKNQYREAMRKLHPYMHSRKLPFAKDFFPIRIIKYGLHPCIPIKLALQLEWKKLLGN